MKNIVIYDVKIGDKIKCPKTKRAHSKRVFSDPEAEKKLINLDDLEKAFISFELNKA